MVDWEIQVRLANGLAAFEESDQVSVITICWNGWPFNCYDIRRRIGQTSQCWVVDLQPNNREDELRSWLQEHGFQIIAESILEEAGKFYEILVVKVGKMNLSASDIRFGPFLSKEVSPVFIQKWQKKLLSLSLPLVKFQKKNQEERQILADKIQAIKEVLHEASEVIKHYEAYAHKNFLWRW